MARRRRSGRSRPPSKAVAARSWTPSAAGGPTTGPGVGSFESAASTSLGGEPTAAPDPNAPGSSVGYADTAPGALDRFLHGGRRLSLPGVVSILVVGWFGFLSWVFLQDNGQGKLDSFEGLRVFAIKVGAYSLLAAAAGGALLLVSVLHNRVGTSR